ncbi:SDR family NAD(P)-dependent oxidoreductase [Pseudomonas sp. JUb52]|uniref:SDR family NAD(P)-dependent oxidoreductase n=1 Tax=Pseudomonas sp. JUb52 TaxID=2485127 RepID=UPI00104BCF8A|nr:SDR family oxidoreductase [Pseudomonas sp. JUb52]TCQ92619.1 NAD(P)-dependent dehydrogenase (short-subunit alcohol dehydrogenase family) [Pseudomonas sp. JUb52]
MSTLSAKVAVVIGGHGGIGGAIAERFATEGATVYASSRRTQARDVERGAGRLLERSLDASDVTALAAFFDSVRREAGRVDVLVVNAGLSEFAPLEAINEEHFDRTFALNVRALLFATQAATAIMPDGGAIVLIGSIAAAIGTKGYGVYGASKAAVRSLARTWAHELAPRNIRVNVVAPGPTDTAMMAATSAEVREQLNTLIPLGRMARVDEVAAAALFLASEQSSFITGAELPVDGGMAQV